MTDATVPCDAIPFDDLSYTRCSPALSRVSIVFTIGCHSLTGGAGVAEQRTAERTRRSLVNLRVSADDRDLITRAAEALGKNRSEFMLDAARQAARDALLDRTLFRLDSDPL